MERIAALEAKISGVEKELTDLRQEVAELKEVRGDTLVSFEKVDAKIERVLDGVGRIDGWIERHDNPANQASRKMRLGDRLNILQTSLMIIGFVIGGVFAMSTWVNRVNDVTTKMEVTK